MLSTATEAWAAHQEREWGEVDNEVVRRCRRPEGNEAVLAALDGSTLGLP